MPVTRGAGGGTSSPARTQQRISRTSGGGGVTTRTLQRLRDAGGSLPRRSGATAPVDLTRLGAGSTAATALRSGTLTPARELRRTIADPLPTDAGGKKKKGDKGGPTEQTPEEQMTALELTIAAIEAEFGLTREQLLADQSQIGQTYRTLVAQVNRARAQGLDVARENAAERGLSRSGILAEDLADVETASAEQIGALTQQRATEQAAIRAQLAGLDQAQASTIAAATVADANAELDVETLRQLLAAGLG